MGGKIPDKSMVDPQLIDDSCQSLVASRSQGPLPSDYQPSRLTLSSSVQQRSHEDQQENTSVNDDDCGSDPDQRNRPHLLRGRRGDPNRFVQIAERVTDKFRG